MLWECHLTNTYVGYPSENRFAVSLTSRPPIAAVASWPIRSMAGALQQHRPSVDRRKCGLHYPLMHWQWDARPRCPHFSLVLFVLDCLCNELGFSLGHLTRPTFLLFHQRSLCCVLCFISWSMSVFRVVCGSVWLTPCVFYSCIRALFDGQGFCPYSRKLQARQHHYPIHLKKCPRPVYVCSQLIRTCLIRVTTFASKVGNDILVCVFWLYFNYFDLYF